VPSVLSIVCSIVTPIAAPVASLAPPPAAPVTTLAPPTSRVRRRFGLHLGLNATLTFDASFGRFWYTGVSTQLTGIAALADSERNFVVSLVAFGGVALPLVDREAFRLTADITPALGFVRSAPVNFFTVGLLAGVRLVHRSGFTAALHLPLVGYAGAPQARRGSVYYYYLSALPSVPLVTVGYTF
jgi:hypothetical protein